MSVAATPSSTSSLSQAARSARTIGSLKRLQTIAIRKPAPRRSGSTMSDRLDGERVVGGDVLHDLEAEAGHARDALRAGHHAHAADVEVAQDLGADAVEARIPLARAAAVGLRRLHALEDLARGLVAAQQHDHAFLVVRDDAHRVLHRIGVA